MVIVLFRRVLAIWAGVCLGLTCVGCGTSPTRPRPATAKTPTTVRLGPAPASTAAPAQAPTLGQPAGIFAQGGDSRGFGQVKPSEVFNGGDPTGLVTGIVWKSWGGPQAIGTGTGEWVGPDQFVADGTQESTTIVAFDLGMCDGRFMYKAVEWYFPQHGQTFDPNRYENICTGSYVPSP